MLPSPPPSPSPSPPPPPSSLHAAAISPRTATRTSVDRIPRDLMQTSLCSALPTGRPHPHDRVSVAAAEPSPRAPKRASGPEPSALVGPCSGAERGEGVRDRVLGLHAVPGTGDPTVLVDQERGPDDPHRGLPVPRLLAPGAPSVRDPMVGVGQEREAEVVLAVEGELRLGEVGGDAHDLRPDPVEVLPVIPQVARLRRAAGRVGFRIEVDEDRPPPQVLEANRGA